MASVQEHNQAVLSSLEKGDIVRFPRGIYNHFGIYDGEGNIIHKDKDEEKKTIVRKNKFDKVCKNSKAEKYNYWDHIWRPKEKEEIIAYAESKIGEKGYDLLTDNCENFATSCRYGKSYSQQRLFMWNHYAGDTRKMLDKHSRNIQVEAGFRLMTST